MLSAHKVLLKILLAVLAKLTTSVDDLIWLIPFVSSTNPSISKRIHMGGVYICVCCSITLFAIIISQVGINMLNYFIKGNGYWNSDRVLSVLAGTFLFIYAIYLFIEWFQHKRKQNSGYLKANNEDPSLDIDNEIESPEIKVIELSKLNDNNNTTNNNINTEEQLSLISQNNDENIAGNLNKENDIIIKKNDENINNISNVTISRLIIIASLGGLDDFSVQIGVLLGGLFEWYEVLIGILIGSNIVILFSVFLSYIKPIANCIGKVPIWSIIFCISVYRLTAAFLEK